MPEEIIEETSQEPKNDWFKGPNNTVYCGDINYQKGQDPIKRDEEGEPLEPEKYEPIAIRPDLPYVKYDLDTDTWIEDTGSKQEAIDSFVYTASKTFMKAIYKNFDSLPSGMKTILTDWKTDIDEFKATL